MKMMACVINDDVCLVRCSCPVCGKVHYVSDDLWSYLDYADNGSVVGRYDGWDDAMDIICEECTDRVEAVIFFLKCDCGDQRQPVLVGAAVSALCLCDVGTGS
jgi:hypothetical protein